MDGAVELRVVEKVRAPEAPDANGEEGRFDLVVADDVVPTRVVATVLSAEVPGLLSEVTSDGSAEDTLKGNIS